ncbi:MAG: hypothetical protein KC431_26100 [Myxococcales bacterium]|nr:hypothetical protein [Myxococcales bacterium]
MSKRELRYETWLLALASHFRANNALRLIYDDHKNGDRLAMPLWLPAGFVELHIWRQPGGGAFVHVLADSAAAAEQLHAGLETLAVSLPWHARASRAFVRSIRDISKNLGVSFHQRLERYPKPELAKLAQAFTDAAPMVGISAVRGKGSEGLAIPLPGQKLPSLWGAKIRIELGDRSCLWHPGLRGFQLPREALISLVRRLQPDERADARRFAIADDLREHHDINPTESLEIQQPAGAADGAPHYNHSCTLDELLWCSADSCFYCDAFDCGDSIGCDLPDCDLPGCDLPCGD